MPVNPDSVIPTWANNYDSAFYTALTDQENDCYTRNLGVDKARWILLWTNLATAMNNWKSPVRDSKLQDLIPAIFTYRILGLNFGVDNSHLAELDGFYIFSMNDFIATTKARAADYYDDLVENPPSSGTYTSAKMTAAVSQVNGWNATETARIANVQSYSRAVASNFNLNALFTDIVPTGNAGKPQMRIEVFTTMNYSTVYTQLSTLTVPS